MAEIDQGLMNDLMNVVNRHSATPDYIIAGYLYQCLMNFDAAMQAREKWYGEKYQMTKDERDAVIEECAKIADGWLAAFGEQKPQFVTAQHWADDAVADIADNIRKLKTAGPSKGDPEVLPGGDLKFSKDKSR
tara:strand:+ start:2084 stop:2482 length:399 start_codon:yes stop_codon:yes gene_type:complete